jgi:hypothetical protein
VLHTWNQQLLRHPQVHCVVPAGGLAPDLTRWIPGQHNFFLPPARRRSARQRGRIPGPRRDGHRQRVRIVHGHGTGILKKTIAELLSHHPHVARFYTAAQQEGGAGATIVALRE